MAAVDIDNEADLVTLDGLCTAGTTSGNVYTLTGDITLTMATFTTVGDVTYPFEGEFDGGDNTIYDYDYTVVASYIGFLGASYYADIHNLILSNVDVDGSSYVGGLVGRAYYTDIDDCHTTGIVVGNSTSAYAGGIVGYTLGSSGTNTNITNCTSSCAVHGTTVSTDDYFGGIVGNQELYSHVVSCSSSGNVQGRRYLGGITGRMHEYCSIDTCSSTSMVKSTATSTGGYVGGIVGIVYDNSGLQEILDCTREVGAGVVEGAYDHVGGIVGYARNDNAAGINIYRCQTLGGNVTQSNTARFDVAGIVGYSYNYVDIDYCTSDVDIFCGFRFAGGIVGRMSLLTNTITNCTTSGEITTVASASRDGFAGGIAGNSYNAVIDTCFSSCNLTVGSYSGGIVGINGESTSAYAQLNNCHSTGNVIWNGGYYGDRLGGVAGMCRMALDPTTIVTNCTANGDITGVSYVGGCFGQYGYRGATNCHAYGNVTGSYTQIGGFVGNGDYMRNCSAHGNVTVTSDVNYPNTVGGFGGGTSHHKNCYATGKVTVTSHDANVPQYIGGFVGNGGGSSCYATGDVEVNVFSGSALYVGSFGGGLWGNDGLYPGHGKVSGQNYATGNVLINGSAQYVGGFAGRVIWSADQPDCFSTGSLTITGDGDYVGGAVGLIDEDTASPQRYSPTIKHYHAPNIIDITGTPTNIGGCVGLKDAGGTVTECYYNEDTTGQSDTGNGEPLSTAEYADKSNFTGFDFDNIWVIAPFGDDQMMMPVLGRAIHTNTTLYETIMHDCTIY